MHFWTQNLSRESKVLLHTRGSLSSERSVGLPISFSWEVYTGLACGFNVDVTCDREIQFRFGLLLVTLYFSFCGMLPARMYPKYVRIRHSLSFSDWAVRLVVPRWNGDWFFNPDSEYVFSLSDFFLGEKKCSRQYLNSKVDEPDDVVQISLPERTYTVKVFKLKITHKRKRWFNKVFYGIDLIFDKDVPVPSKVGGLTLRDANAWNNCYYPTASTQNALSCFLSDVCERRKEYGTGVDMYVNKKCTSNKFNYVH